MKEYITCAAIWFDDGAEHEFQPINIKTGIVVCGHRHHNCIHLAHALLRTETYKQMKDSFGIKKQVQGFLTSFDRFVNREEAGIIAFRENQIPKETNCLFSEDFLCKSTPQEQK
jgi:hypothetical protein